MSTSASIAATVTNDQLAQLGASPLRWRWHEPSEPFRAQYETTPALAGIGFAPSIQTTEEYPQSAAFPNYRVTILAEVDKGFAQRDLVGFQRELAALLARFLGVEETTLDIELRDIDW